LRRKAQERNEELEKMNTNLVTVAALWRSLLSKSD